MTPERAPHYPWCQHKAYHLTCSEHEHLLARAAGRCEICGGLPVPEWGRALVMDHDHKLGWRAIRGLLCRSCNAIMSSIDRGIREPDQTFADYIARPWHREAGIVVYGCPPDCAWTTHRGTTRWVVGRG